MTQKVLIPEQESWRFATFDLELAGRVPMRIRAPQVELSENR